MPFQKGHIPWNKGQTGSIPWNKGKTGIFSQEALRRIGDAAKIGRPWSKEKKEKFVPWNKGKIGCISSEGLKSISEASKKRHHKHNKETIEYLRQKAIERWQDLDYRQKFMGSNNSSWLGGISFEPYPIEWKHCFKEEIRNRDNRLCQYCGMTEKDNGRLLDVHHIDYDKKNIDFYNLISLCVKCHRMTGGNREYWQKYFTDIIKLRFPQGSAMKSEGR